MKDHKIIEYSAYFNSFLIVVGLIGWFWLPEGSPAGSVSKGIVVGAGLGNIFMWFLDFRASRMMPPELKEAFEADIQEIESKEGL